jgi:hypothetical protein
LRAAVHGDLNAGNQLYRDGVLPASALFSAASSAAKVVRQGR